MEVEFPEVVVFVVEVMVPVLDGFAELLLLVVDEITLLPRELDFA